MSSQKLNTRDWIRVVIVSGIGTILEWFDFFVYAQLKDTINAVFFPPNMDQSLFDAFYWAIYAGGYAARPIGAIFSGWLGDTFGRNIALMISISFMALSTVAIGVLPAYSYGPYTANPPILSPIFLAIFRTLQGFFTGGEYGTALVYISELAEPKHKCFKVGLIQACVYIGLIISAIFVMVLDAVCNQDQMLIWGWRIPFLVASLTALLGFILRRGLPEPEAFIQAARLEKKRLQAMKSNKSNNTSIKKEDGIEENNDNDDENVEKRPSYFAEQSRQRLKIEEEHGVITPKSNSKPKIVQQLSKRLESLHGDHHSRSPIIRLLRNNWIGLLLQIGYSLFVPVGFNLTIWLQSQIKYIGLSANELRGVFIVNCVCAISGVLIVAHLLDKGQRAITTHVIFVIIGMGTFCGVSYAALTQKMNEAAYWCLTCLMLLLVGCDQSTMLYPMVRVYAPLERTTGFGIGINVANGVIGGVSPLIVTSIIRALNGNMSLIPFAPTFWMLGLVVIALACSFLMNSYASYINMKYLGYLED